MASYREVSWAHLFSFYTICRVCGLVISFHAAISALLVSHADKWEWRPPAKRIMMMPAMFLKIIRFLLHTRTSGFLPSSSSVEFYGGWHP